MLLRSEVLLLDEPTNDLDIETMPEIEDWLAGWRLGGRGSATPGTSWRDHRPRGGPGQGKLCSCGRRDEYWRSEAPGAGAGAGTGPGWTAAPRGPPPDRRRVSAQGEGDGRLERKIARLTGHRGPGSASAASSAHDTSGLIAWGPSQGRQGGTGRARGALADGRPRSWPGGVNRAIRLALGGQQEGSA